MPAKEGVRSNGLLLTLDEVAAELRVNISTVQRMVRAGELPTVKVGERRLVRVRRSDLEAFVSGAAPARG